MTVCSYGEQITQRRRYEGRQLVLGEQFCERSAESQFGRGGRVPKREGLRSSKPFCITDMNSMLAVRSSYREMKLRRTITVSECKDPKTD